MQQTQQPEITIGKTNEKNKQVCSVTRLIIETLVNK